MNAHFRDLGLAVICFTISNLPAWAHHSHNAYEVTQWLDLEGVVKEVHLMNPHRGSTSMSPAKMER